MTSSTSVYTAPAFCERLRRTVGIQSDLCFIVGYVAHGNQPQIGASPDALTAFYGGSGARILIAAVFYGVAVLNLMWFSAGRTSKADAGYDGCGAAASASSAVLGGLFFLLVAVVHVVAYSIAGSGTTRSRPA